MKKDYFLPYIGEQITIVDIFGENKFGTLKEVDDEVAVLENLHINKNKDVEFVSLQYISSFSLTIKEKK